MQQMLTRSYSMDDWRGGAKSLKQEFDYEITDIEGEIPAGLEGTWFQNIPAMLDVNGTPLFHPWDADGMICSIAFAHGKVHFRNRFVQTEGYLAEQKAQRILYRGIFGTQKPGGILANIFDFRRKNIANTNIVYWGKKLLALWEAGQPHIIEPQSLDTLGIETLQDRLNKKSSPFCAHPKILRGESPQDDRLIAFGLNLGVKLSWNILKLLRSTVDLYELNVDGQIVQESTIDFDGFAFIHDFMVTPNYYVFFQSPTTYNFFPYVLGLRGAAQGLNMRQDRPLRIWVISRQDVTQVQKFESEALLAFHHANAFEQDGKIIVTSILYDEFFSFEPNTSYPDNVDYTKLPAGRLYKHEINLDNQSVESTLMSPQCVEFPRIHPDLVGRPNRFVYLGAAHQQAGSAPLQAIVKLDLETGEQKSWSAAPRGFVGEPIFVPADAESLNAEFDQTEDRGWILTFVYDAASEKTDAVILDAQRLDQGPVARLHLSHHIPYTLHGSFVPEP